MTEALQQQVDAFLANAPRARRFTKLTDIGRMDVARASDGMWVERKDKRAHRGDFEPVSKIRRERELRRLRRASPR
jgi:hypothetical protein